MRHIPESYVKPLYRILEEYEQGLRNKGKLSLSDRTKLWHLDNIKNQLTKIYDKDGSRKY